jgi:biotin operon repressor
MARRTIAMIAVRKVIYRWQKGMSKTAIAQSLGLSRNTVKVIIKQAKQLGLTQNSDEQHYQSVMTQLDKVRQPQVIKSNSVHALIANQHAQIVDWLEMPHYDC